MSNVDKIKEQIQKILAKTGDGSGATEAEMETALRFARRLMLKHNVSQEDLEEARDQHESDADAESVEYGKTNSFTAGKNLSQWESSLARAIASLVGTVKWFYRSNVRRLNKSGTLSYDKDKSLQTTIITFYGPADDARDAVELLEEWTLTVVALARLKYGGALRGNGRSYAEGFCFALADKVRMIKKEEQQLIDNKQKALDAGGEKRSTALMVLNANQLMLAKRKKASTWLEEVAGVSLGRGGRSGGSGSHDSSAFGAGQSDGRSADFNRTRQGRIGS